MKEAVSYGDGIRILNQDLWEAVISFIISASNNIPRIKGIIERLCENFGKQISYMGKTYYTFPDTDTIYSLSKEDLSVIRSGFRDKYIMDAADKFKSGTLTEEYIKSLSTPDAKKALMTINGQVLLLPMLLTRLSTATEVRRFSGKSRLKILWLILIQRSLNTS